MIVCAFFDNGKATCGFPSSLSELSILLNVGFLLLEDALPEESFDKPPALELIAENGGWNAGSHIGLNSS